MAEGITDDLKHKMVQHAQLIGEFEKNNRCISRLVIDQHSFSPMKSFMHFFFRKTL